MFSRFSLQAHVFLGAAALLPAASLLLCTMVFLVVSICGILIF